MDSKNTFQYKNYYCLIIFLIVGCLSVVAQDNNHPSSDLMQPYYFQNGQYYLMNESNNAEIQSGDNLAFYIKGRKSVLKRTEILLTKKLNEDDNDWVLNLEKVSRNIYKIVLTENLTKGNYTLKISIENSPLDQYFNLVTEYERHNYNFSLIQ